MKLLRCLGLAPLPHCYALLCIVTWAYAAMVCLLYLHSSTQAFFRFDLGLGHKGDRLRGGPFTCHYMCALTQTFKEIRSLTEVLAWVAARYTIQITLVWSLARTAVDCKKGDVLTRLKLQPQGFHIAIRPGLLLLQKAKRCQACNGLTVSTCGLLAGLEHGLPTHHYHTLLPNLQHSYRSFKAALTESS